MLCHTFTHVSCHLCSNRDDFVSYMVTFGYISGHFTSFKINSFIFNTFNSYMVVS